MVKALHTRAINNSKIISLLLVLFSAAVFAATNPKFIKAVELFWAENFTAAAKAFEQNIQTHSHISESIFYLAVCHHKQNQNLIAISLFKTLELKYIIPDQLLYNYYLGRCREQAKLFSLAAKNYQTAINNAPESRIAKMATTRLNELKPLLNSEPPPQTLEWYYEAGKKALSVSNFLMAEDYFSEIKKSNANYKNIDELLNMSHNGLSKQLTPST